MLPRSTEVKSKKRKGDDQTPKDNKRFQSETPQLTNQQRTDLHILARHLKAEQTKRKDMQQVEIEAQATLFKPTALGIDSTTLTYSSSITIDASVGSSGFLPPEGVVNAINTINENGIMEYNIEHEVNVAETNLTRVLRHEGVIEPDDVVEFTGDQDDGRDLNKVRYAVVGCGSQHIITTLFGVLIKRPGDVIVIPTPTYGLFLQSIKEARGNYQFIPLKAEKDFNEDPEETVAFISHINDELREIHSAKLAIKIRKIEKNISRNNPQAKAVYQALTEVRRELDRRTSLGKKAIATLNQEIANFINLHIETPKGMQQTIFKELLIEKLSVPFRNCVRGYLDINPHNPTGKVKSQTEVNNLALALSHIPKLQIIADHAHKDISITNKQIGFFSRSKMSNRTVSVFSYSKRLACAALRTGYAIGSYKLIDKIANNIYRTMVMPPISVFKTCNVITGVPQTELDTYYNDCNTTYRYRFALAQALIDGIDSVTDKALNKKIRAEVETSVLNNPLETGIKNLSLLTQPDGCFFIMLDLSAYKGYTLEKTTLVDGIDFAKFFYYLADVEMIPGETMGYFDKPCLRFSLTISEDEICRALTQISKALSYLEAPAVEAKFLPRR